MTAIIIFLLLVAVVEAVRAMALPDHPPLQVAGTGPLVESSGDRRMVLRADGLAPGLSKSAVITVRNRGQRLHELVLETTVHDQPGPRGGLLSSVLRMTISELSGPAGGQAIWTGRLLELGRLELRGLARGEHRSYRVTVSLPRSARDDVQGSAARFDLRWGS